MPRKGSRVFITRALTLLVPGAALAIALLAGCLATGPTPPFAEIPARAGYARLYVYREQVRPGFSPAVTIRVDDSRVGLLPKGGYLALYLPPGVHVVYAESRPVNEPGSFKMIAAPGGQSCFVRFYYSVVSKIPLGQMEQTTWLSRLDTPDAAQSQEIIRHLALNNSNFDVLIRAK
jgi:hypothetical protein